MEGYKSVANFTEIELNIKKSRFLGFVIPVKDEKSAMENLEKIRKIHKSANHNCYAWRIGTKGELQRCSDDGEPQGTAGKPMLEVINKEDITNILVVVTRYFGGIKLGAGGLIRAYAQTVKEVLEAAEIVNPKLYWQGNLGIDYKELSMIKNILLNEECIIKDINYVEIINLIFLIPLDKREILNEKILEVTCGKNEIDILGQEFWEGSSFNP